MKYICPLLKKLQTKIYLKKVYKVTIKKFNSSINLLIFNKLIHGALLETPNIFVTYQYPCVCTSLKFWHSSKIKIIIINLFNYKSF